MEPARRLEYRVLGPLDVLVSGRSVRLGGPKPRALLAVLLMHRNEVVSVDRLVDALWGERPPRSAATMLHGYVSRLRRALDGGDGAGADVLATRSGGYVLEVEPDELDLTRFEELVEMGSRASADGSPGDGARALREALALWRGPPLADLAYEPALQDEILRLESVRLEALRRRIDAELATGRHAELVAELEVLARRHPLDEGLHGQLMIALSRSGRSADALDTYRGLRRRLAEELGLEPDPELRELQAAILRRDPGLGLPAAEPRTAQSDAGRRRRAHRRAGLALAAALVAAGSAALAWAVTQRAGEGAFPVEPNSVAMIDTRTNRVIGDVVVGDAPIGPVTDGHAIWTASAENRTLSRVGLDGGRAETTAIEMTPWGLTASSGWIWVSAIDSPSIARLDARYGTVEKVAQVPDVQNPAALAATPTAIWFARRGELLRTLDPRSGRVMRAYATVTNGDAVEANADAAWVGTAGASVLARVDAKTGAVTSTPVAHSVRALALEFGSLWVVFADDDRIWRLDPNTLALRSTIRAGRDPRAIAVDPVTRSVWIANTGSGTVSRIDPFKGRVVATVATGHGPSGLAVAGGIVWVAVRAAPDRAEPSDERQPRLVASIRTGQALGLTSDSHAIWVVERREGRLARIDPKTNRVVARVFTGPTQEPVAGPGGIWVPSLDTNQLLLVDPVHNRVAARLRGAPYFAIAAGVDDVWALTQEPDTLSRIDARTRRVVARIELSQTPRGVAFGDGAVWVCGGGSFDDPRSPGWIRRIDPETNAVVAEIPVPRLARKVAYGFGSVWATLHGSLLVRINPATNEIVARIRTSKGGSLTQDYIAFGDRSVWVTNLNNGSDAELVEVDPRTNGPVSSAPLLQGPLGVTVAFGSVWVAHFGGARVLRFAPTTAG